MKTRDQVCQHLRSRGQIGHVSPSEQKPVEERWPGRWGRTPVCWCQLGPTPQLQPCGDPGGAGEWDTEEETLQMAWGLISHLFLSTSPGAPRPQST